jgi:hypothetical protein
LPPADALEERSSTYGFITNSFYYIDLEIDRNYDVFLKQEIWKGKGETDEARSGNFKGNKAGPIEGGNRGPYATKCLSNPHPTNFS